MAGSGFISRLSRVWGRAPASSLNPAAAAPHRGLRASLPSPLPPPHPRSSRGSSSLRRALHQSPASLRPPSLPSSSSPRPWERGIPDKPPSSPGQEHSGSSGKSGSVLGLRLPQLLTCTSQGKLPAFPLKFPAVFWDIFHPTKPICCCQFDASAAGTGRRREHSSRVKTDPVRSASFPGTPRRVGRGNSYPRGPSVLLPEVL